MRVIYASLAVLLAVGVPAQAASIKGGKIVAVDDSGKNFTYRWKHRNFVFRTTEQTRVNGDGVGNAALSTGQSAKIQYVRKGPELFALIVGIGF